MNAPDPAVVAVLAEVHAQHEEDGWQAADDLSGSVYACTCGATSSPLAVGPHIDEEDVKRAAEWFAEHVATAQATALAQAQDPAREALATLAADLYRDHAMPPNKDRRNYAYRDGWWDAIHHAAGEAKRRAKALAPRDADEVPT